MTRGLRRTLLAAALTVGLVGMGVPVALAGEMDDDTVNNKMRATISLTCKKGKPLKLSWTARAPKGTVFITAKWQDFTDKKQTRAMPETEEEATRGVRIKDGVASGTLTIPNPPKGNREGHRIALFVDAFSGPTHIPDQQTYIGIGRNSDIVDCSWPPRF